MKHYLLKNYIGFYFGVNRNGINVHARLISFDVEENIAVFKEDTGEIFNVYEDTIFEEYLLKIKDISKDQIEVIIKELEYDNYSPVKHLLKNKIKVGVPHIVNGILTCVLDDTFEVFFIEIHPDLMVSIRFNGKNYIPKNVVKIALKLSREGILIEY